MSEATDAAKFQLEIHREDGRMCHHCNLGWPCDTAILAREVLAQEQRVCGTCKRLEPDDGVFICLHRKTPLIEFTIGCGDPMTFGCPFHEPASEEAGT